MGTKGVAELEVELAEGRARIDALEGEAHLAKTLSRILDGTPAYITHLDLGAKILYLSKLQPGFTPDSYKGKTVFDFTDPKDHGALRACLETALRTKDAASHTSVGAGAHGKPTRYFTRVAPIVEDGEVTSFVLLATEVTEVTTVIGALEESEKNLAIALGASRMGLWSFEPGERGSVTDARTREIFGLQPGWREMSGPDLAKNLLSQHPHLKRLFISGFPAHASGDGGVLEKKMFLQKPFSKAALGARVREALDDRRS